MDTGTQKKLCQLLGKINERLESRSDPKAREVRKKIGVLRAWLENAHSADSTAQSLPSAKEVPSFGEILLSRPVLEADNAFIKLEMPPDQTDETNIIASSHQLFLNFLRLSTTQRTTHRPTLPLPEIGDRSRRLRSFGHFSASLLPAVFGFERRCKAKVSQNAAQKHGTPRSSSAMATPLSTKQPTWCCPVYWSLEPTNLSKLKSAP